MGVLKQPTADQVLSDLGRLNGCSTFWYLASPYSRYYAGTEEAFRVAAVAAAELVKAKVPVFCPIAHSHPVAVHGGLPLEDHEVWLPADKPFMETASGVVVLMIDGWNESVGVAHEIEHFERAGKPVWYLPWSNQEGLHE